jgi:methyl-accepting chemotaxis protein
MSSQAEQLQQAMSFFKLSGGHGVVPQQRAKAKPAAAKKGVGRSVGGLKMAGAVNFAPASANAVDESQFARF